jgi:hypothetical protein
VLASVALRMLTTTRCAEPEVEYAAARTSKTTSEEGSFPGILGGSPYSLAYHSTQSFQPLPPPLGQPPYHSGGIKNGDYQTNVANAMRSDLSLPAARVPSFFYHLGDVVYFNGQPSDYYSQFYEPYDGYAPPIISIPGNHDGDPKNSKQISLDGWVAYFMTAQPHVDPESGDAPRVTVSQPNVYFTLLCPYVTVIGMYTNVPDGGSVDSVQQQWVSNEFATADPNKALIAALHHPIYSFDDFHSGSPNMANVLDQAINDSQRVPIMVLTGHVHNYQRIEQSVAGGITIPFIVGGNGGYCNLRKLNAAPGTTDPDNGASLMAGDDQNHGYMILTVDANSISGSVTSLNDSTGVATPLEQFSYPAAAQTLPPGTTVNL